ncbi:hypothetical protein QNH99_21990 (plasmid) [Pantoea allii]|uniref:hypothetical protein n=1 Tax=Pantoea allii TaxID=574096 RepID=UPI00397759D8
MQLVALNLKIVRLPDDQKQAVMIHQVASVPARDAGALFVKAASYGAEIKAVIDFLFMLFNDLIGI